MRIMLNDYAGHPFPVQLSRSLARAGHTVLHTYFAKNNTPRGPVAHRADDPHGLAIEPLSIAREFRKHALWERWRADVDFGQAVSARLRSFSPDVVLSANMPLDTQRSMLAAGGRATRV